MKKKRKMISTKKPKTTNTTRINKIKSFLVATIIKEEQVSSTPVGRSETTSAERTPEVQHATALADLQRGLEPRLLRLCLCAVWSASARRPILEYAPQVHRMRAGLLIPLAHQQLPAAHVSLSTS